jgi:hypothetical protein
LEQGIYFRSTRSSFGSIVKLILVTETTCIPRPLGPVPKEAIPQMETVGKMETGEVEREGHFKRPPPFKDLAQHGHLMQDSLHLFASPSQHPAPSIPPSVQAPSIHAFNSITRPLLNSLGWDRLIRLGPPQISVTVAITPTGARSWRRNLQGSVVDCSNAHSIHTPMVARG